MTICAYCLGRGFAKYKYEQDLLRLVDCMPRGKAVVFNDLTDEQSDKILELVDEYASGESIQVSIIDLTVIESDEEDDEE